MNKYLVIAIIIGLCSCGSKQKRQVKDPQSNSSRLSLAGGVDAFYVTGPKQQPYLNTLVWTDARSASNVELTADLLIAPNFSGAVSAIELDQVEVIGSKCLVSEVSSSMADASETDVFLIASKDGEMQKETELNTGDRQSLDVDMQRFSYKIRVGLTNPRQCDTLTLQVRFRATQ